MGVGVIRGRTDICDVHVFSRLCLEHRYSNTLGETLLGSCALAAHVFRRSFGWNEGCSLSNILKVTT